MRRDHRVVQREVDDLAKEMFQAAFGEHGIRNRPRASNDNPHSESDCKTMKDRPGYPGTFTAAEDARACMDRYVPWHERWQQRDNTLQDY
jgi:putative transposase